MIHLVLKAGWKVQPFSSAKTRQRKNCFENASQEDTGMAKCAIFVGHSCRRALHMIRKCSLSAFLTMFGWADGRVCTKPNNSWERPSYPSTAAAPKGAKICQAFLNPRHLHLLFFDARLTGCIAAVTILVSCSQQCLVLRDHCVLNVNRQVMEDMDRTLRPWQAIV